MDQRVNISSQVLVLEHDPQCLEAIKRFCQLHQLKPLRVQPERVLELLQSGLDLGGILLSEHFGGSARAGLQLARRLHALRCELPIFLRRDNGCELQDLPPQAARCISAAYTLDTLQLLQPAIQSHVFCLAYPNSVVRSVMEQSERVLQNQFRPESIELAAPRMVQERLLQGDVFTLVPIDNHWCNGYMLLQVSEFGLQSWIRRAIGEQNPATQQTNPYQNLNRVLAETAHRLSTAFKNSFLHHGLLRRGGSMAPVVIHQSQRYLSIGSDNPQLCFQYTLSAPNTHACALTVQQKLVLDLNWSPEVYLQETSTAEQWFECGVLETA